MVDVFSNKRRKILLKSNDFSYIEQDRDTFIEFLRLLQRACQIYVRINFIVEVKVMASASLLVW